MISPKHDFVIVAPRAGMFDPWFAGFARYGRAAGAPTDEHAARIVWRWLLDGSYRIAAVFALDREKRLAGFAHYRPYPDILTGVEACALDAVAVDDAYRGQGLERLLLASVCEIATLRGWSEIRWTAASAVGAALANEGLVHETGLVTYQVPLVR
jgi:GNAT superfamily N-acetyltransferase